MAIARDLEDDKEAERALMKATRKEVARAAFTWFLTRLLLLTGLCVLCCVGALAFQALEMPNEQSDCEAKSKVYIPMEEDYANKLWNIGQRYYNDPDNVDQSDTIADMGKIVNMFYSDFTALSFDGRNCSLMGTADGVQYKWNTFGSVLFATTIFTTVGYGNIAPLTDWGRILCFAYGMIGIPYMLWCLSVLGELMADVFQFVYVNLCCLGFCARRARKRRRERIAIENRKRLREAVIEKKLGVTGIPPSWRELYETREEEMNKLNGAADALIIDQLDDQDEMDDDIAIPLTVTLLVIFGYIMLGAVLFGMWENWDGMAAAYFCFITISTIGFGDIVPGAAAKGVKATTDTVKMMVAALYICAGMAIISMAFNLIQENMARKARAIEQKLTHEQTNEEETASNPPVDIQEPVTARGVMPSLPPARMSFAIPTLVEGWAEKSNAFMKQQQPSPLISIVENPATPFPDTDDQTSKDDDQPKDRAQRSAHSVKKMPTADAADEQKVEETSFSDVAGAKPDSPPKKTLTTGDSSSARPEE